MNSPRPIEQQFDLTTVQQIRQLTERARRLRSTVPKGATSYYFAELVITLEAGALLASMHIAATILELFVRALIVDRVSAVDMEKKYSLDSLTYQEKLEENRGLGFGKMLDHLASVGLFSSEDVELAKQYYQEVRTPLAHGLLERFINGRPTEQTNIMRLFKRGGFTSSSFFEDAVEDHALSHIEVVVGIVERNTDG
jgi:DNA-binding transcriptional regulator YbjK